MTVDGVTVGAIVACNALGDVVDPETGQVIAGARTADGKALLDTRRALLRGDPLTPMLAGSNTTIGVIATDAVLTKSAGRTASPPRGTTAWRAPSTRCTPCPTATPCSRWAPASAGRWA